MFITSGQRSFSLNFAELSQFAFVCNESWLKGSSGSVQPWGDDRKFYFWWWDVLAHGIFHMEIFRVQECTLQTAMGSSACVTLPPESSQLCSRTVWAGTQLPLRETSFSLNYSLLHKAEWQYCFLRSSYMFRVNINQVKCRIKLMGSWRFVIIKAIYQSEIRGQNHAPVHDWHKCICNWIIYLLTSLLHHVLELLHMLPEKCQPVF